MKFKFPQFDISHLLLLVVIAALLLGVVANGLNQQPVQNFTTVAFSPSGERLAVIAEANTLVFDVESGKQIACIPVRANGFQQRQLLTFKNENELILYNEGQGIGLPAGIYNYDLETGDLAVINYTEPFDDVVAISSSGYAVRRHATSTLHYYPSFASEESLSIPVGNSKTRFWLSHDGRYVILFDGRLGRGSPNIYDLNKVTTDNTAKPKPEQISGSQSFAAISPDATTMLIAGEAIQLLNLGTNEVRWEYPTTFQTSYAQFSNDGSRVAAEVNLVRDFEDHAIIVLDNESGNEIFNFEVNGFLSHGFAFSPDGNQIAFIPHHHLNSSQVEIWDIDSYQRIQTLGRTHRMQMLIWFPLFIMLWTIIWSVKQTSKPRHDDSNNFKAGILRHLRQTSRNIFLLFSWFIGAIIVFSTMTLCFWTLSRFGHFGNLHFWKQLVVIAIVFSLMSFGVWLMVIAIKAALRTRQQPF